MELTRRRVLVVEDEPLVAMLIEDMLLDLGHQVVGPAFRVQTAIPLAQHSALDLAILDVNIADETSFPIAEILQERRIPFLFATGYGKKGLTAPFTGVPTLSKPFNLRQLEEVLQHFSRDHDEHERARR